MLSHITDKMLILLDGTDERFSFRIAAAGVAINRR